MVDDMFSSKCTVVFVEPQGSSHNSSIYIYVYMYVPRYCRTIFQTQHITSRIHRPKLYCIHNCHLSSVLYNFYHLLIPSIHPSIHQIYKTHLLVSLHKSEKSDARKRYILDVSGTPIESPCSGKTPYQMHTPRLLSLFLTRGPCQRQ